MRKSISYVLILSIVLSMILPMGVMAEGDSAKELYDALRVRFKGIDESDLVDAASLYGVLIKEWDQIIKSLDSEDQKYLEDKGITKDSVQALVGVLESNKNTVKKVLKEDAKYEDVKNDLRTLAVKFYGALPEAVKDSINVYAPDQDAKIQVLANLLNEFQDDKFGSGDYKDGKWIKLNIKLDDSHRTRANNTISKKTTELLTEQHLRIANGLILGTVSRLSGDNLNIAGDLLYKADLIGKNLVPPSDPFEPSDPGTGGGGTGGGGGAGGGGGGGGAPSTGGAAPTTPGEINVPEDTTEPATATIGDKEATVKTVDGVVKAEVKEDKAVAATEALRKEAGKDREAVLVVKLDGVKGTNIEVSLSEKVFTTLSKERVDLHIITKDVEYIVPSDALANTSIPKDATVRLVTEDVDKDIVKSNVEEHHDVKKVVELYIEIVKGNNITKVTKFKSPITVKINVKALGNKDMLAVYYLDEEDDSLEFVTGKIVDGKAILRLSHFSKYIIVESTKTFPDVANHWSKIYVESMAAKNVVGGYDDGNFRPDAKVTRAEFSKMVLQGLEVDLVRYDGEFKDVNPKDWYADYVATMKELGLAKGYDNGTFKPDAEITRAEMAVILSSIVDVEVSEEEVNTILGQFKDESSIPAWAKEAIAKVVKAKVMVGSNGNFAPNNNTTRAESATTIYRIY